ncbi:hypothetical protein ACFQ6Q_00570 [Streptomyces sp. NPDC056437]|uniref:hypothetical protein n=1 Tax=Streptomyces sp. NPDC056437 TaxID=3345816 RepID=UPI0036AF6AA5
MSSGKPTHPPVVTFTTGAALLMQEGLVESITPEGLRYLAKKDDWPFGMPGEGRKYEYGKVGNAKTMETKAFLDYFRTGPPRGGRGRPPQTS